mmetsp:Transcript_11816/g.15438  ORF Transcript_11816/g.15438 Transcript_11816/m.15438 type:complete len:342 (+) Transcript_11816:135-1160(+)|eukprot:CAMPEP_0117760342 /NCGR_PEP_ID=MMETSP0947-20121206/16570_1 /TAXON_ID=44440 /ORGANISM="Chattonella subsalsa, Strain CCMP2191" /LENGTH=341 /DNA_ID=CAMNT_0005581009 /DNA_START=134 /DNA_END=1159 /DNA_ORIENTATION=+
MKIPVFLLLIALQLCVALGGIRVPFSRNTFPRSKQRSQNLNLVANTGGTDSEDATADSFVTGLISGAAAGITVDLVLFPLDTIKTRLQARANSNVIKDVAGKKFIDLKMILGVYDGILPAIAASAPCAATFFGAYDSLKTYLAPKVEEKFAPLVHLAAAAGGDLAQSVIRVPFEIVKQRLQAGIDKSALAAVSTIMKTKGLGGFYTGWGALALRDLPFDAIEFPLYEFLKYKWSDIKKDELAPWEGSLCGSLAGGIAAALTTPLDVAKTRLMTSEPGQYKNLLNCLQTVLAEEGMAGLFAGVAPRVGMITFGGAIFFGAYEYTKAFLTSPPSNSSPKEVKH